MSARFIDTGIWDEDWFCEMGGEYQALWGYVCAKCDNAGIWKPNKIDFEVKTRFKIRLDSFLQKVNENGVKQRILVIESGRWFLTGFIAFQWFNKKEAFDLVLSNRLHKHLYELLIKNKIELEKVRGLREVLERSTQTSKDKERDKDNIVDSIILEEEIIQEDETEEIKPVTNSKSKPHFPKFDNNTQVRLAWDSLKNELPETISTKEEMEKVKNSLAGFLTAHKPQFLEPYATIWNMFAAENGLSAIDAPTDKRLSKIRTRAKEPDFDFLKVLQCIKRSSFLKGSNDRNWKVDFDHIIRNDENYIKILEGKYT